MKNYHHIEIYAPSELVGRFFAITDGITRIIEIFGMTTNSKPCTLSQYLLCATVASVRFPLPTVPRFHFTFPPCYH